MKLTKQEQQELTQELDRMMAQLNRERSIKLARTLEKLQEENND